MAVFAVLQLGAAEITWQTDLPQAQARAREENKLVMLNFTGSDWCQACEKFQKRVLSKSEFIEYARTNLVAVEVDFPEKKKLSDEQTKANDALAREYKVEGYPTIVILNSEGKKLASLDPETNPKEFAKPRNFLEKIESFKK